MITVGDRACTVPKAHDENGAESFAYDRLDHVAMCAWVVDFQRWQLAGPQNVVCAHLHVLGSTEALDKGLRSLFSDSNTEKVKAAS